MIIRRQTILKFGILTLLLMASTMSAVQAGSVLKFGGPESSNPLVSFNEVDHANSGVLVRHCVDHRGQVCYRKWSNNRCDVALLQADLFHLTQVDLLRQSSREATLAYYINALTLWGILTIIRWSAFRNWTGISHAIPFLTSFSFGLEIAIYPSTKSKTKTMLCGQEETLAFILPWPVRHVGILDCEMKPM